VVGLGLDLVAKDGLVNWLLLWLFVFSLRLDLMADHLHDHLLLLLPSLSAKGDHTDHPSLLSHCTPESTQYTTSADMVLGFPPPESAFLQLLLEVVGFLLVPGLIHPEGTEEFDGGDGLGLDLGHLVLFGLLLDGFGWGTVSLSRGPAGITVSTWSVCSFRCRDTGLRWL
jgi:hypothetical protein